MEKNVSANTGHNTGEADGALPEQNNSDVNALLREVEQAEQARKIFDSEYETMRRAVVANLYTKAELYKRLQTVGFALDKETFMKWWTRKGQQAGKNGQAGTKESSID